MVLIYQQFEDLLVGCLRKLSPEAEIVVTDVRKNNNVILRGASIKKEEESISPTVYLQGYYSEETCEEDIEIIANKILELIECGRKERELFSNVEKLTDFDEVANNIFYTVVNIDKNRELLKEVPHRIILDLAVVYKIHVDMKDGTTGSVQIKNDLLKHWNTSEKELFHLAEQNTERMFGTVFKGMGEMLIELSKNTIPDYLLQPMEEENSMFVSTNITKTFGAVNVFLNDGFRAKIQDKIGDFYILPSSIHETIIVKPDNSIQATALKDMVHEVNRTELDPMEYLSDNVYFCKDNVIQILN